MRDLIVIPRDTLQELVNMAETISNNCESVVEAQAVLHRDPLSEDDVAEIHASIEEHGEYSINRGEGFDLDGYYPEDQLLQMAYLLARSKEI